MNSIYVISRKSYLSQTNFSCHITMPYKHVLGAPLQTSHPCSCPVGFCMARCVCFNSFIQVHSIHGDGNCPCPWQNVGLNSEWIFFWDTLLPCTIVSMNHTVAPACRRIILSELNRSFILFKFLGCNTVLEEHSLNTCSRVMAIKQSNSHISRISQTNFHQLLQRQT